MTSVRVGPFALRQCMTLCMTQRDHNAPAAGDELWRAARVVGERSPAVAAVRRVVDLGDRAGLAVIGTEYAALRQVSDPRVPAVLGHYAGQGALAMSWAAGPSLLDAVTGHRQGKITLSAATVLDLCGELADTLRSVHSARGPDGKPLVHGQLEAHRVRLGPDGQLMLLGLGRPLRPGGLSCLPPEVLDGGPPSPQADTWALGALLLELLSGQPLYGEADGGWADLATRREGRMDRWIQPVARINPGLGRLLARMLAADPQERFSDQGELVRSLASARRALPGLSDRLALFQQLTELAEPEPSGAQSAGHQDADAASADLSLEGTDLIDPAAAPDPALSEATVPLLDDPPADADSSPSWRAPVRSPATRGRLGAGEKAAIAALVVLLAAGVLAVLLLR